MLNAFNRKILYIIITYIYTAFESWLLTFDHFYAFIYKKCLREMSVLEILIKHFRKPCWITQKRFVGLSVRSHQYCIMKLSMQICIIVWQRSRICLWKCVQPVDVILDLKKRYVVGYIIMMYPLRSFTKFPFDAPTDPKLCFSFS